MHMKNIIATLFIVLFFAAAYLALFGGKNTGIFIAVTAVVAFGVSLFNFYYQHFRSVHNLSCTLVAIGYNGKKFIAHYTFENLGTHQEIVLGGTFVFPGEGGEKSYSFSTLKRKRFDADFMPEIMMPFIISPKEIILKKFEWDITYEELLEHFQCMRGADFRKSRTIYLLSFKVDFVNPKTRTKSSILLKSTDIQFYDNFVSCRKPYTLQNNLFDEKL